MTFKWFFLAPSIVTIGFLFSLISIGSEKWYSYRNPSVSSFYMGLWKNCSESQRYEDWTCHNIRIGESTSLDAVRALVLISAHMYFFSSMIALVAYIKDSSRFSFAAVVVTILEALLFAIGLIVYVVHLVHNGYSSKGLGWSYGTGWAAVFILLLGTGAYAFQAFFLRISKRKTYVRIN